MYVYVFFFRLTDEAGARVNKGYNNEKNGKCQNSPTDLGHDNAHFKWQTHTCGS